MTLLFVDLIRSFRIRKKPNEVGRVKSVKAKQPAGSKENIYFSSCFFFKSGSHRVSALVLTIRLGR